MHNPDKTRQLLFSGITLIVAIIITLASAEILVRFLVGDMKDKAWVGADKLYYEYDSLLGWRKIPNTETTRISIKGQNSVFYQVNSKGFRGPEYPYKKPDNEYRILFLGDSFTEGYMVEIKDHFAQIMEQELNSTKRIKHILAMNSGTAGWSTDQELLFFQNEGKKYAPDLTILMFYQNDLSYNNEPKDWGMYYKPLFKITNDGLVLTNVPVPKPDKLVYSDQLSSESRTLSKKIREWLHLNSRLYRLVKERINSSYFLHDVAVKLKLMEKPASANGIAGLLPREYNVLKKQYNKSVQASWQITEVMIKKLKEEVEAVGSRLLVFYIPDEAAIHRDEWVKLQKKYGLSDEEYDVDKPGIELESVCKRNGIDFLNPTKRMIIKASEFGKQGKRLYDPIDHHWNIDGYRYVGELLTEYVRERYLQDASSD